MIGLIRYTQRLLLQQYQLRPQRTEEKDYTRPALFDFYLLFFNKPKTSKVSDSFRRKNSIGFLKVFLMGVNLL